MKNKMKTYIIYTDGSDFKHSSHRLGIGGVIVDPEGVGPHGKEISSFSQKISPEFIKLHYGTDDCSNPTMEIFAVLFALKDFKGIFTDKDFLIIRADYIGIKNWFDPDKPWKITKHYIQKIHDEIIEIIRKENLQVRFEWIKGHQNKSINTDEAYWNNVVDNLSKGV